MFLLIYVTVNIKTVHVARMQAWKRHSVPLINAIVSNALLHSNSCMKQMPPQIIHILHFCAPLPQIL